MDSERMKKLDICFRVYDEYINYTNEKLRRGEIPVQFPWWLHRQYEKARNTK